MRIAVGHADESLEGSKQLDELPDLRKELVVIEAGLRRDRISLPADGLACVLGVDKNLLADRAESELTLQDVVPASPTGHGWVDQPNCTAQLRNCELADEVIGDLVRAHELDS